VIAALDGVKVLPDIHVLPDPPPSLLQTTREARVLNETCSKDLKSILQEGRRGDQIRKRATDLTQDMVSGQLNFQIAAIVSHLLHPRNILTGQAKQDLFHDIDGDPGQRGQADRACMS
jgi:hypothetical protein